MRKKGKHHPKLKRKKTGGPPLRAAPRPSPGQKGNAVQLVAGPHNYPGKPRFNVSPRIKWGLMLLCWTVRWTFDLETVDPSDIDAFLLVLTTSVLTKSTPVGREKNRPSSRKRKKKG